MKRTKPFKSWRAHQCETGYGTESNPVMEVTRPNSCSPANCTVVPDGRPIPQSPEVRRVLRAVAEWVRAIPSHGAWAAICCELQDSFVNMKRVEERRKKALREIQRRKKTLPKR